MFTTSRFPIELVPHDPAWAVTAAREAERLQGALGDVLLEVLHIGSTAIPTIRAKPIVDLAPVVTALDALDAKREAVVALGYEWRGEFGISGRRYCVLVDETSGKRIAQLHMFAHDAKELSRHVTFRDYLRAHVDEARAYEAQKLAAMARHPDDVNRYNDAKSDWIRACEKRAAAWAAERGR